MKNEAFTFMSHKENILMKDHMGGKEYFLANICMKTQGNVRVTKFLAMIQTASN
jgi:hypothetical protein